MVRKSFYKKSLYKKYTFIDNFCFNYNVESHKRLSRFTQQSYKLVITAQEAPGSQLIPSTPDECSLLRLPCFTVMTFPTQEGPSDRLPNLDAVLG